jgi:transcriptional regulator with XRE-family HTH domain
VPVVHRHPALLAVDPARLRAARLARGWTQLQLARAAGVALATAAALETGHQARSSALPALAAALGIPAASLQPPATSHPTPAGGPGRPPAAPAAHPGVTGQHPVAEPGPHLDGARLRELRTSRAMTQAELAARAGLSRSFISSLECGHRRRASVIPVLARALAAAPADLTTPGHSPGQPPPLRQLTPIDAARLRGLRSQRGLTQLTLATRAGLTPQFISGLENRHYTRTRALTALAGALGTNPGRLATPPRGPDRAAPPDSGPSPRASPIRKDPIIP